jgi:hypothetical protein
VIRAFCGDPSQLPVIEEEWENYDHDQDPESDQCQVVAADASQKDAILLSRKGVSFVLQGPPGTGKSQTITNIIAQAMADGKRVLFVSQKMAALSVVYRRLEEAGIADYCLSLHNYKAEKKAVLQDLARTLDAPKRTLKSGYTHVFDSLEEERNRLNLYDREMNLVRMPLGRTLFDVVTDLSGMEDVPLCTLEDDTLDVSGEEYEIRRQLLAAPFPRKAVPFDRADWEANMARIYTTSAPGYIALQDKVGHYATDRMDAYLGKEEEIRAVLAEVPAPEEIDAMLRAVGLEMEEFYELYSEEKLRDALLYAKDLKDRYTVLWMYWDLLR